MSQEAFFFNIVAYAMIAVSVFVLIGVTVLFFRDGMQQEPRFAKVLKFLGFAFALGLLFLGANAVVPWIPFYVLGVSLAGTPAVITLFVAGGFLHESTKMDAGITLAVLGAFGGIFFGTFLLVVRYFLENS